MRFSRLLVLPVVAAVLAVPETATAGTADLWVKPKGVAYDVCHHHPYGWSVTPDVATWRLDVTLHAPNGEQEGTESFEGETSDSTSGESFIRFCSARSGRFTVDGTLTEFTESGEVVTDLDAVTVQLRRPHSKTSLKVSDATPHYNEVVTFRATAKKERPSRYVRAPYAVSRLQVKTPQGWANVRGSKRTANGRGVTVWKYLWNVRNTLKLRAVTLSNGSYTKSTSGLRKIDERRGGRVVTRPAGGAAAPWVG